MGLATTHPAVETVKVNLENYRKVMGLSRAPSDAESMSSQKLMLATLKTIFRQEGDVFHKCFTLFLEWCRAHVKDCMAPNARFRGMHLVKDMNRADQSALMLLVNLACMTAVPATRNMVLARFDFGRLGKLWPAGQAGEKLEGYFAQ